MVQADVNAGANNEEVVKNVETRSYWVIDQFGPRDQPFFLSNPVVRNGSKKLDKIDDLW